MEVVAVGDVIAVRVRDFAQVAVRVVISKDFLLAGPLREGDGSDHGARGGVPEHVAPARAVRHHADQRVAAVTVRHGYAALLLLVVLDLAQAPLRVEEALVAALVRDAVFLVAAAVCGKRHLHAGLVLEGMAAVILLAEEVPRAVLVLPDVVVRVGRRARAGHPLVDALVVGAPPAVAEAEQALRLVAGIVHHVDGRGHEVPVIGKALVHPGQAAGKHADVAGPRAAGQGRVIIPVPLQAGRIRVL